MRTSQLTITRFIAAVSIVVFHFGKGIYPFNSGLAAMLFNNANVAVSYFFNLSGFVMIIAYGSAKKEVNTKDYYINRLAKIYPVYLLALLVMLFYAGKLAWAKLIGEVLLIHAAVPSFLPSYNLPDWSLSVEMFFYLVFPFLFNKFYLKNRLKVSAMAIVGFWLISQIASYLLSVNMGSIPPDYVSSVFYNPLVHFNEFFVGNLIGLMYLNLQTNKRVTGNYPFIFFLILMAAICLVVPHFKAFGLKLPVNFHNGFLSIVFAPFILLLALNAGRISRLLSAPFLVYLGEISYCIYILQFAVFQSWWAIFGKGGGTLYRFYLPLLLLLLISALAYHLVELPGKRFIRARLKS